jgi:hypothetical protein
MNVCQRLVTHEENVRGGKSPTSFSPSNKSIHDPRSTGVMQRDPLVICSEGSSTDSWASPIRQTAHPCPAEGVRGHDQKEIVEVVNCPACVE